MCNKLILKSLQINVYCLIVFRECKKDENVSINILKLIQVNYILISKYFFNFDHCVIFQDIQLFDLL